MHLLETRAALGWSSNIQWCCCCGYREDSIGLWQTIITVWKLHSCKHARLDDVCHTFL